MGKIIAVASGKGGTGKTSFTACVGLSLAAMGYETLALDCDITLRNVDLALGLSDSAAMDFSDVLAVLWKEVRVAFLCGAALAAANFVKMQLVDRALLGNSEVTMAVCLVVCLTVMFVVIFAKCVGCSLPLLAEKIGLDPAVMASPFITTIVDATSLLIYFALASAILGI